MSCNAASKDAGQASCLSLEVSRSPAMMSAEASGLRSSFDMAPSPDPRILRTPWGELRPLVDLRPLWAQAHLVLPGHALLEKLVNPYKSITAHVYRSPVPIELGDDLAKWDGWLAGQLNAVELATKPFTPLPVLGVPSWWTANQNPAFYDDASVFRGLRILG